ncbi:MAG TPA: hypothetical protein VGG27_13295 [Magnetospirillaceae bacterium]|jgi:hypothetical protein
MPIKFGLAALLAALLLSACTSNVQPAVTQFGSAIVAAQSAESAFISALNQKQLDQDSVRILTSAKVTILADKSTVVPFGINKALATSVVPQDAVDAINSLLKPVQAYGQAMQALSGDTAAATLDTNVDNLSKQASTFDTSVLTPLGAKGLPTAAEINGVATAVKDIGNIIVAALISKDVKAAATNAQPDLKKIVAGLELINSYWSGQLPNDVSEVTISAAVVRWNNSTNPPSYEEKVALKGIWEKAAVPLTADGANKALDAIVTANAAIANSGPVAAKAQIQALAQAASDAYSSYKAFAPK